MTAKWQFSDNTRYMNSILFTLRTNPVTSAHACRRESEAANVPCISSHRVFKHPQAPKSEQHRQPQVTRLRSPRSTRSTRSSPNRRDLCGHQPRLRRLSPRHHHGPQLHQPLGRLKQCHLLDQHPDNQL